MPGKALRVLFATAECAPFVKTGGLGDVSAALPLALHRRGIDVRVLLPGYPAVLEAIGARATQAGRLVAFAHAGATRLLQATRPDGVPLLVADHPWLFARPGSPYQDPTGLDWPDNPLRFGLFSKVAAALCDAGSPLAWRPDVVHCNDWHTGLAPVYVREASARASSVFTIHNLAYQGIFARAWMDRLDLAPALFALDGVEFHGALSFMKGALRFANAITTVSPTYAREIATPELGFGLDGLLRTRQQALVGILNGIDTETWNPADDPALAAPYDVSRLDAKARDKAALQAELRLAALDVPLFGVVSRLVAQKGIDLVADVAEAVVALPAQIVVLGSGDAEVERRFAALAARHPGHVGVVFGFDDALAHRIEAGADVFLMPSRFEPCGMNQMYSQRYGTPPIANATGGLVDTIVDDDGVVANATGFLIPDATEDALLAGVARALAAYREPQRWKKLQVRGMTRDFGWEPAARAYRKIYEAIRSTS